MTTRLMFGRNFDESVPGAFDDTLHFDSSVIDNVVINTDVSSYPSAFRSIHDLTFTTTINALAEFDFTGVSDLDLLPLIPDKFHKSVILQDYVSALNTLIGGWLRSISDIKYLHDPWLVGADYIGYLADLIGLKFVGEETATITELRKQLLNAIAWYKTKGTYQSLQYIGAVNQLTVQLYDFYTKDYADFVEEPWFVADYVEENPPDLDSSYYKSPHFGFEIIFDKLYGGSGTGSLDDYLWVDSMFTNVNEMIEMTRPANTVPHIRGLLECVTTESGDVYITPVRVRTCILGDWEPSMLYFDQTSLVPTTVEDELGNDVIDESSQEVITEESNLTFDGGFNFDQSRTAFLSSVNKYKIGTGNKGVSPGETGFALESVVYTGDVHSYEAFEDRVVFDIFVDSALSFSSLSELGLFSNSGTTMVVASTFPNTDKTAGMELHIQVEVRFS